MCIIYVHIMIKHDNGNNNSNSSNNTKYLYYVIVYCRRYWARVVGAPRAEYLSCS